MPKFISMKSATNHTLVAVDHIRQVHYEPSTLKVVVAFDRGTVICENVQPSEWKKMAEMLSCYE